MPVKRIMVDRVCVVCGTAFSTRADSRSRTCSMPCRMSWRGRERVLPATRPTTCERCGVLLTHRPALSNARRFCSGRCARMWRMGEPEVRFWLQVDRRGPDGCWIWRGRTTTGPYPYGSFHWEDMPQTVHRIVYVLCHGAVPDGTEVAHLCHHALCVNPAHLFATTHADNILHSWIGGRTIRGDRTHTAKMTDASVREMRVRYFQGWTYAALAREYGVRLNTVWSITHYRTWKHVE